MTLHSSICFNNKLCCLHQADEKFEKFEKFCNRTVYYSEDDLNNGNNFREGTESLDNVR